ncbi:MAG: hypothetical protein KDK33_04375 [Leptospiraceae bacterium]|nr:hypothetical protein [Leptospiraceae bacterium]
MVSSALEAGTLARMGKGFNNAADSGKRRWVDRWKAAITEERPRPGGQENGHKKRAACATLRLGARRYVA